MSRFFMEGITMKGGDIGFYEVSPLLLGG